MLPLNSNSFIETLLWISPVFVFSNILDRLLSISYMSIYKLWLSFICHSKKQQNSTNRDSDRLSNRTDRLTTPLSYEWHFINSIIINGNIIINKYYLGKIFTYFSNR